MGLDSGSCSPTVRRGEARQERGEGRVDSPWGPWLPGQHRPCCVLAPRAPRLLLPGRLREGDQSVAPASSDVSLCPVATACPMSWSPPPSRPATPSGPRTGHHEAQGPVCGWAGRAGLAFSSGSLAGLAGALEHWPSSSSADQPWDWSHLPPLSGPRSPPLCNGVMLNDPSHGRNMWSAGD